MTTESRRLSVPDLRESGDILRDLVRGKGAIDESFEQLLERLITDERESVALAAAALADFANRKTDDKEMKQCFRRLLRGQRSIAPAMIACQLDGLREVTEDQDEKEALLRFTSAYRQILGLVGAPENVNQAVEFGKASGDLDSTALASLDLANKGWQAKAAYLAPNGSVRREVTSATHQSAYADEVIANLKTLLPKPRSRWPWIASIGAALALLSLCAVVMIVANANANAAITPDEEVQPKVASKTPALKTEVDREQPSLKNIDLIDKSVILVAPDVYGSQQKELLTYVESVLRKDPEPVAKADDSAKAESAKVETSKSGGPRTIVYRELPIARKFSPSLVADQSGLLGELRSLGRLSADYVLIATRNLSDSSEKTFALVLYSLPKKAFAVTSTAEAPATKAPAEKASAPKPVATAGQPLSPAYVVPLERVWSKMFHVCFESDSPQVAEGREYQVERLRRSLLIFDSKEELLIASKVIVGRDAAVPSDFSFVAAALLRAELRSEARDILRSAFRIGKLDKTGSRLLIALEGEALQHVLREKLHGMKDDAELLRFFQPLKPAEREQHLQAWIKAIISS